MRPDPAIPERLTEQFAGLRRRIRAVRAAGGIGTTLLVAVLAVIFALFLDLFFDLPEAARVLLLFGVAGLLVLTFLGQAVSPLFHPLDDEQLAALVESVHPEYDERLLSLVELSREAEPSDAIARLLRTQLTTQTLAVAKEQDFQTAFDTRTARRRCWLGGLALLVLLAPLLFASQSYGMLLSRFVNPWSGPARIRNLILEVDHPDRLVGRDEDVVLQAHVSWRFTPGEQPETAVISWTPDDGIRQSRLMDWDEALQAYTVVLPRVQQSLTYAVTAGGARTGPHRINVADRPELTRFSLEVVPPASTGLPRQQHEALIGEIEVLEQSRLLWSVNSAAPITRAELLWTDLSSDENLHAPSLPISGQQDTERSELELAPDGRSASFETLAALDGVSGNFLLRLTAANGLTTRNEAVHRLTVHPDRPPEIAFGNGEQEHSARPDDLIEIALTATDDFGLAQVELHCELPDSAAASTQQVFPAPIGQQPPRDLTSRFRLDLSDWTLDEGSQLILRGRAVDTRSVPGPNETWTPPLVIHIRQDAPPAGTASLQARQQQWAEALTELQRDTLQQAAEARQLQAQAENSIAPKQDWEHEQAESSLIESLTRSQEKLDQLAASFDGQPLLTPLAEDLRGATRSALNEAHQLLSSARNNSVQRRPEPFQRAADELDRAGNQLQQLQQDFETRAQLQRDLLELNRLADHSERLADRVEDLVLRRGRLPSEGETKEAAHQQWLQQHALLERQHLQLELRLQLLVDRHPVIRIAARENLTQRLLAWVEMVELLVAVRLEHRELLEQSARELAGLIAELAAPVLFDTVDYEQIRQASAAAREAEQLVRDWARDPLHSADESMGRTVLEALRRAAVWTPSITPGSAATSSPDENGLKPDSQPVESGPADRESEQPADAPAPVSIPPSVAEEILLASRHLSEAGRQLAQLGRSVAVTAEPSPDDATPSAVEAKVDSQQARADAQPAAPELPTDHDRSSSPAESLRAAANSLRQMANQTGAAPQRQSDPRERTGNLQSSGRADEAAVGNEQLMPGGDADGTLGPLSERRWGQLPEWIRSDLLQARQRRPEGEYADRIQQYFEAITRPDPAR